MIVAFLLLAVTALTQKRTPSGVTSGDQPSVAFRRLSQKYQRRHNKIMFKNTTSTPQTSGNKKMPLNKENLKGELEQIVIVVPEDKKPDSTGTNTEKPADKSKRQSGR
jgi:hypothetical protein